MLQPYLIFTVFCASFMTILSELPLDRLGDVHTSVAHISQLVKIENKIVTLLKKYVKEEMKKLNTIQRYYEEWNKSDSSEIVGNPLSSYHFMQRLHREYKSVENALSPNNTLEVLDAINGLKSTSFVPNEADVNGAAWAIIRLQDVYNLTFDELLDGKMYGVDAKKKLTANDCIKFGDQSFMNLEFDLSEKWTRKGIELLESKVNISAQEERKAIMLRDRLNKRNLMRGLITEIAQKSDETVQNQFSGLGIPISFQKEIRHEKDAHFQISQLEQNYLSLCRGEEIRKEEYKGLTCGYTKGDKSMYRVLMPIKLELIWPDPIVFIYHDVLTDNEMQILRQMAYPKLETTEVHSFISHSRMKSLARIGKTAWVKKDDSPLVSKILKRVEHMTGLSTTYGEDFHILNYGIGGHYDIHVDFFDLQALNDVTAGGATVFPLLKLRVPPKRGSALVWFNLKRSGKGDYRTLHASCPVLLGQKWIANLWLHEFDQEFRWPCSTDPEE